MKQILGLNRFSRLLFGGLTPILGIDAKLLANSRRGCSRRHRRQSLKQRSASLGPTPLTEQLTQQLMLGILLAVFSSIYTFRVSLL
jgi:hypothetical protein